MGNDNDTTMIQYSHRASTNTAGKATKKSQKSTSNKKQDGRRLQEDLSVHSAARFFASSKLISDKEACAHIIEDCLHAHTNYNYKILDLQEKQHLGIDVDPLHVPLFDWIKHLIDHTSPSVALLAVIYIRRALCPGKPDLNAPVVIPNLTTCNLHRVFFMAVMIASKYLMDVTYSMRAWQNIALNCWNASLICQMEGRLLQALKWQLYVNPDDLARFLSKF
eukprot:TRINITY_DN10785_c0_g1::TRINITY_DN10785_c0_g1_i1::g.10359::m.10359 TRINITY_DN10785_c0_g1::TRINITY_DN10785_c0_g1_i1::g.10359  ORF type:complete len:221 (-),score=32.61,Cyclin_N/PF00134.18/9e-09,Cyclin/PF08613.6/4.8e-08,MDFI/PF15316.1/0.24 TRINITY_DN10785_c0_g1_i1:46-708(-)